MTKPRLAPLAFSLLIGSILSLLFAGVNLLFATLFVSGIICGCTADIIEAIRALTPAPEAVEGEDR